MKKPFSRALAAVLAASALAMQGCGIIIRHNPTAEKVPQDTTAPAESTIAESSAPAYIHADRTEEYTAIAEAHLSRIAAAAPDYDGRTFFIASPRTDMLDGDAEGDQFSAAVYRRNHAVTSTLNAQIAAAQTDSASFFDQLSQSTASGEYFADLLMIPTENLGAFAVGGVLMNLRSVPMLDLTQPYFLPESAGAATVADAIWAVAGHASLEETTLCAVYFNRDLFERSGLTAPYADVYAGNWTWDRLMMLCASVSARESWAAQYSAAWLPAMIHAACGGKMVRTAVGEMPKIAMSADDSPIFDVIRRLYGDENRHRDTESGVSAFHSGSAAMLIDRLYLMSWMPNSAHNWGILPLPKLSENQKNYVTLADPSTLMFALPGNSTDAENAAIILSALNAASYGVLREAYADYAMNELLRDNDSANMLPIIAASCRFDFAAAFAGTVPSLTDAAAGGLTALAAGLPTDTLLSRAANADAAIAKRFQS